MGNLTTGSLEKGGAPAAHEAAAAASLEKQSGKARRLTLLDTIRGTALISMALYHAVWDIVYLFDIPWMWFAGNGAFLWQQSICWTFILLSGFCWSLGAHPAKRGVFTFGAGAAVTVVSVLLLPESQIIFGILTLLGSCTLLMIPVEKLLRKVPAPMGGAISLLLFVLARPINQGFISFGPWTLFSLPDTLYNGLAATYFGFTDPSFFSTDYFSLLPWCFLFLTGYFIYRLMAPGLSTAAVFTKQLRPLSFVGRHSLLFYLLHQPVIYGVLWLIRSVCG